MKTTTISNDTRKAKIVANIITIIIASAAALYIIKGVLMQAQHAHVFGF